MLYPHSTSIAALTGRTRAFASLAALGLTGCMAFVSWPAMAADVAAQLPAVTVVATPSEPAVTSSAAAPGQPLAPGGSTAPPASGASTDAATNAPSASSASAGQFIPYSMAAQAAARVAPAAAASPAARPKVAESLSAYVAERWQIGQDQALRLVNMAHRIAADHALDPLLLLAVAARESGFQYTGNAGSMDAEPNAKKVDPGTAHGLMQVAGRFHPDKMPVDSRGRMRVTTDEENLNIGAQLLRENLSLDQGDVGRALQRYNGNLRDAGQRFARYVLRVRQDLQHAIRAE